LVTNWAQVILLVTNVSPVSFGKPTSPVLFVF